jgi:hypothetical protein
LRISGLPTMPPPRRVPLFTGKTGRQFTSLRLCPTGCSVNV